MGVNFDSNSYNYISIDFKNLKVLSKHRGALADSDKRATVPASIKQDVLL